MKDLSGFNTSEVVARLSQNPAFAQRWAEEEPKGILAANLAKLRHEQGLTQLELATLAGMKQPRIAEIESGEANPKLETLGRLAAALNVNVADLFADQDKESVTEYQVSVVLRDAYPYAIENWSGAGTQQSSARGAARGVSAEVVRKRLAANDTFALSA